MNTIFDSETFKKWYEGKGFKSLTEMEANKVEEYRKGGIDLNGKDKLKAKKEILADFVGEMLFGGKNQISDSLFSELDDNHKKTFREWIGALIDRLKTLFKGNKTAEDEITKLEAKFKEMLKESLKSEAPGETNTVSMNYNNRTFSYDELVAKANIKGTLITKEQQVKLTEDGLIDVVDLLKRVRKKCSFINTKSSKPTYYVRVNDIGENVEVSREGILHGVARKNKLNKVGELYSTALTNAQIALDLPNILANSIEVNRSSRGNNIDVPYTHVMLGVSAVENENGNVDYYAVRFMVEERLNQNAILVETNVIGKLFAVNAKKIAPFYDRGATNSNVALTTRKLFEYSVAHLLEDVKGEFKNTFSKDVYEHFGVERKSDEFSDNLQFSYTPETDTKYLDAVNRGDTETAQKMVDEAAKAAGYNYHLYHGTNADFTKFDLRNHGGKNGKGEGYGIYLAANREISAPYGKNVIDSYVKFNRLAEGRKKTLSYAEVKKLVKQSCEVEAKRAVADGEADSISEAIRDTWVSNYVYTYDYSSMAKVYADVADMLWEENDNDGELINEIMASSGAHYNYAGALDFYENILTPATGIDGFHYIWGNKDGSGVQNDVYLAFKSEQIKSADPITYDDNGDIIPLSQRFNEDESDIRFSYTPADEQELTRMAQNGEISAEEYGRRMLEMRESRSGMIGHPTTFAPLTMRCKRRPQSLRDMSCEALAAPTQRRRRSGADDGTLNNVRLRSLCDVNVAHNRFAI